MFKIEVFKNIVSGVVTLMATDYHNKVIWAHQGYEACPEILKDDIIELLQLNRFEAREMDDHGVNNITEWLEWDEYLQGRTLESYRTSLIYNEDVRCKTYWNRVTDGM